MGFSLSVVLGNSAEMVKFVRSLANKGDANSQHYLGTLYENGQGVPQDYNEAVKWCRLSANQGFARAQSSLGFMNLRGLGTLQDNMRAHMWFNIAASQGSKTTRENRDFVAKKMTPADISAAQKIARKCVRKKYKGC